MNTGFYWVKYLGRWQVAELLDTGKWLVVGCEMTHTIEEMDEVLSVPILDYETTKKLIKIHDRASNIGPFKKGGFEPKEQK